jgi:hypothetical protein
MLNKTGRQHIWQSSTYSWLPALWSTSAVKDSPQ